ncbi:uncharacterized protein involved in stress response [Thioflavicoccus mobilis 8321]|uniref:Uncharacterized protein involved in stress response n=1 Tax=Thioflavicoccus mobilis 8321 TaxID=765912 RepID=L0H3U8_9GAMM|nr:TerD family protein [Thioflavicoccus mobilis]AGA92350.1 uncharacterized protein involved in stress response [Thioflavicoccus mobilis 8321]
MTSVALQPGANTSLSAAPSRPTRVIIAVGWTPSSPAGLEIDASAFLLGPNGKVRGDDDLVFYNNPRTADGSVATTPAPTGDQQAFLVEFAKIAGAIEKIAFCVTIHEGEARRQSFGTLQSAWIRALDANDGAEIARFDLPLAGRQEVAMIFCEVYRRNQEWKLRAVGQGFNQGLAPLASGFGIQVDRPAPPPPAPPRPSAPPPRPTSPAPAPATPPARPVNLEKITLEKRTPISLEKRGQGFGEIVVNLNWNRRPPPAKGFFAKLTGSASIDLDLGCLYKLRDGRPGAVQALGNVFGSLQQPPYVRLMGDDRTGASTEGEFLHINGQHWDALEKILVFAFIYQGVPNWSATDAVVTIRTPGQPTLELRLDSHRNDQNMCALALLENDRGNIKVTKQVEYFRDHALMDRAYGFGLRWVAGRKD